MSSASPRKEPSMDEILASIRRIIESGDERPNADGSTLLSISPETELSAESHSHEPSGDLSAPASPLPHFDVHYLPTALGDESLVARHVPEVEAVRREPEAVEVREAETTTGEAHAPSVVDVEVPAAETETLGRVSDDAWWDAAVADANDVEADASSTDEPASAAMTASVDLPPPDNENAALPAEPEMLRSNWHAASVAAPAPVVHAPRDFDVAPDPVRDAVQPVAAPVAEPLVSQPSTSEAPVDLSPRSEIPESVIAGASALLSTQAGDQVAAAFDDLTRAIREGHLRSMEGMAREIMRPMLQEWLDDNLPRIVERLVREEIERIARGPRR